MNAVQRHLAITMLLVSCALGQSGAGNATVQNVAVTRDGRGLRVEITLSAPVQPSAEVAVNPDRILLDLPGTTSPSKAQTVVNMDGLRRIRAGQHSTNPMVTRVVLDLDRERPYEMKLDGTRIILTLRPVASASRSRSSGPASPTSLGLSGIFRRKGRRLNPRARISPRRILRTLRRLAQVLLRQPRRTRSPRRSQRHLSQIRESQGPQMERATPFLRAGSRRRRKKQRPQRLILRWGARRLTLRWTPTPQPFNQRKHHPR